MAKLLVAEGTHGVAVGTPVAVLVDDEEALPAFADYVPRGTAAASGGEPAAATAGALSMLRGGGIVTWRRRRSVWVHIVVWGAAERGGLSACGRQMTHALEAAKVLPWDWRLRLGPEFRTAQQMPHTPHAACKHLL